MDVVRVIEGDRFPGRKIWFGSLEDTVDGLQVHGRVRMKPYMLRTAPDYWTRVEIEEVLYLDATSDLVRWVTVRGAVSDLESANLEEALTRATRCGVFVRISRDHAVAPARIRGVMRDEQGRYQVEMDSPTGDPVFLPLDKQCIPDLEECLEVLSIGGSLLFVEPEDFGE
ncbi:MAG: LytTR family DNA-binding domain-containing protein [Candidatus Eremiobacterota bacterium]